MQDIFFTPRSFTNGNPYPFPARSGCEDLGAIWLLTPGELLKVHRDVIVVSIGGVRYHASDAVEFDSETRYGYTPYGVYRNQFMDVAQAHEQAMLKQMNFYLQQTGETDEL